MTKDKLDSPEWDMALWLDILTVPGTHYSNKFFSDLEAWIFTHYTGDYVQARVDWSKAGPIVTRELGPTWGSSKLRCRTRCASANRAPITGTPLWLSCQSTTRTVSISRCCWRRWGFDRLIFCKSIFPALFLRI